MRDGVMADDARKCFILPKIRAKSFGIGIQDICKVSVSNSGTIRWLLRGGGGGGVALGRILFVLPKMWSKLELSLMRLLRAKFGKICQSTKKIKDAVVYGWGTPIFPKSPKENKTSLNMSTVCLLRKIDAQ